LFLFTSTFFFFHLPSFESFLSSPNMKIPFSILFTIILSLDVFAAPVPTAQDGTELVRFQRITARCTKNDRHLQALEVRKTPAKKPVAVVFIFVCVFVSSSRDVETCREARSGIFSFLF
jgi:hypothetical protein